MTEREIMEKIKASAEEIVVPEGLSPENVKKRLEEVKKQEEAKKNAEEEPCEAQKAENEPYAGGKRENKKKRQPKHWGVMTKTAAAAAVCIICGTGLIAGYQAGWGRAGAEEMAAEFAADVAESVEETIESKEAGSAESEEIVLLPKQDAGELYVVAGTYEEVYDRLNEEKRSVVEDIVMDLAGAIAGEGDKTDVAEDAAEGAAMMESAEADHAMGGAGIPQTEEASDKSYAKTNLQTAGVDESDIIKTDGSYLYIVKDHAVEIIDIRGSSMKKAGTISISLNSGADRVVEMYVDGNKLNLIVEREETRLEEQQDGSGDAKATAGGAGSRAEEESSAAAGEEKAMEVAVDRAVEDVYYINTDRVTELVTYDITDRENPVKKGSIAQDGTYKTSRKIGDIVYLFTEKQVELPQLTRGEAVTEENAGGWIPLVDGKAVAADCIYLPEEGSYGLLVSSVDVDTPDKVVDNTLILNNYVNIYVSAGALYLYNTDYSNRSTTTQLAKFNLDKGAINAAGAASAAGEVYDTFAINEYQGKLRLLTTDWSDSEGENRLYLFDKDLNLTGSLTGIAKGEQIYAARFLEDTAYFVTYRNIDPLFAVDLSDAENPKILSELKITGFSEYLHFWGEDKLIGIGYETDPDTGEQKGIKLAMFDISNPAKLKTAGGLVLGNIDYSPALYDYKCVLADAGENLIGFVGEAYKENCESSYLLFSWENGGFKELMTEKLDTDENMPDEYRGIYVGDTFYLASPDYVTSYDREDGYRVIEKLEL